MKTVLISAVAALVMSGSVCAETRDHRQHRYGAQPVPQGGVSVYVPGTGGYRGPKNLATHVRPAPQVQHPTNWQGQNAHDHRGRK